MLRGNVETWKHSPAEARKGELFGDGKRLQDAEQIDEIGRFELIEAVNNDLNEDSVEVGVGQKHREQTQKVLRRVLRDFEQIPPVFPIDRTDVSQNRGTHYETPSKALYSTGILRNAR